MSRQLLDQIMVLKNEEHELLDQIERMRPVVEAAVRLEGEMMEWKRDLLDRPHSFSAPCAFMRAVRTYLEPTL